MAALPIPKEAQAGVAKLLLLSDEANQELMAALESAPLSFGYQELAENIAERVKSIEPDSADEVVQVLLSLYLIRSNAKVSIPEFIEDFIEGIHETDLNETFSKVPVDKFKQWLTRFLQVKALVFTTNALLHKKTSRTRFVLDKYRLTFDRSSNRLKKRPPH